MTKIEKEAQALLDEFVKKYKFKIAHNNSTYEVELCESDLTAETMTALMAESSKEMKWSVFNLRKTDAFNDYLCELITDGEPVSFRVIDERTNSMIINFPFCDYRLDYCKIDDCELLGPQLKCYGIEKMGNFLYGTGGTAGKYTTASMKKPIPTTMNMYTFKSLQLCQVAKPQGIHHVQY